MQLTLIPPADFSFYHTIHSHGWRALLPFSWDEDTQTLFRVQQLTSGEIVMLAIAADGPNIRVTVEPAAHDEAEIRRIVSRVLQMDIDLAPFYAVSAAHPELSSLTGSGKGRMLRSPTLFEDICKVILTTNTTWAQTKSMNARLIDEYGDPLPETVPLTAITAPPSHAVIDIASPAPAAANRKAYPRPETIAATNIADFAANVRLGYRSAAIHELATNAANGTLDLEALESREISPETLRKQLLALRGVGPYAAACLMLYLARPTPANVDSWARTLLAKELGHPVTDKEVHAHFAKYGDWQGLVYNWYPWTVE